MVDLVCSSFYGEVYEMAFTYYSDVKTAQPGLNIKTRPRYFKLCASAPSRRNTWSSTRASKARVFACERRGQADVAVLGKTLTATA